MRHITNYTRIHVQPNYDYLSLLCCCGVVYIPSVVVMLFGAGACAIQT